MYSIDPNLLLSTGQPPHPYSFLLMSPRGLLLAPSSFLSTSTAQLTPPHYFLSSLSMLYFPSCLLPSSRGPSPIPSRFHLLHAAFLPPTSAQLQIKIYFLLDKYHPFFPSLSISSSLIDRVSSFRYLAVSPAFIHPLLAPHISSTCLKFRRIIRLTF